MFIESVFEYQKPIPAKYTCEGENVSPPLKFGGVPKEAKSLVIIMDDPDAPNGTFDHWVIWNVSPETTTLSEGGQELFSKGSTAKFGTNHYNETVYKGPCPPPGKPHRYFFKVFALDISLDLPNGANKKSVEKSMEGHILDKTVLMGTYQR